MLEQSWAETSVAALPDGGVPGASEHGVVDGMFFSVQSLGEGKKKTTCGCD